MFLTCFLFGWHKFNDAHEKEFVKSTGLHIVFFSSGIQKGKARCIDCGKEFKVYREGFVGAKGSATDWKIMDKETEKRIDSLPTM